MSSARVYPWSADMGEISGFGGGYEATCQAMLQAGLRWIDEHPSAQPRFHGYHGITGIVVEDNDDAKALSKAIVDASAGDCTGAMHEAVVRIVIYVREHGWDTYCAKRRAALAERGGR